MKHTSSVPAIILLACSLAGAQEMQGDRIVVPSRNGSRPRLVKVETHNGAVLIKAYNGNNVEVETRGHEVRRPPQARDGMHRLNLPLNGLEVEEEDNVVNVRLNPSGDGDLVINVPVNTSVNATAHNGAITVEGVHGEITAQSHNGKLNLINVSGTVVANTHNEAVKVVMDQVDPSKPLSFASWNGNIDVTVPADFKSNIKVKARNGEIWTDFDVKLTPGQTIAEKNPTSKGFKIKADSTYSGTINGGGVDATFSTYNGNIYIRKPGAAR